MLVKPPVHHPPLSARAQCLDKYTWNFICNTVAKLLLAVEGMLDERIQQPV